MICLVYARNIPKIRLIFVYDMHEIFCDMPKICLRFASDVPMIYPSFSLFIQLYFVYDVQWSEDQFHIFVNVTRDKIMSPTVIVTMAVVR